MRIPCFRRSNGGELGDVESVRIVKRHRVFGVLGVGVGDVGTGCMWALEQ